MIQIRKILSSFIYLCLWEQDNVYNVRSEEVEMINNFCAFMQDLLTFIVPLMHKYNNSSNKPLTSRVVFLLPFFRLFISSKYTSVYTYHSVVSFRFFAYWIICGRTCIVSYKIVTTYRKKIFYFTDNFKDSCYYFLFSSFGSKKLPIENR